MAPPQQEEWFPAQPGDLSAIDQIRKEILDGRYVPYLEKDQDKNARNALLSWLQVVEVVEAEKTSDTTSRLVLRFPVQHEYLNPAMTLHGGHQSTFHDTATTWTLGLIRKPGFWQQFGTSRTLNVTYIRPAVEGEILLYEAELVHAGKRLCLMRGSILREKDRALISTCEHQKVNIDGDKPRI